MQFFTILQDRLHSFNIQDDRSTRFFCKTNYRIDHIIKSFHEENSITSGLFSQNNLLLCGMQGNNGLLAKTFKTFPKSPIRPAIPQSNPYLWVRKLARTSTNVRRNYKWLINSVECTSFNLTCVIQVAMLVICVGIFLHPWMASK